LDPTARIDDSTTLENVKSAHTFLGVNKRQRLALILLLFVTTIGVSLPVGYRMLRMDNGPEVTSQALRQYCVEPIVEAS
jgi:hypothetical protein